MRRTPSLPALLAVGVALLPTIVAQDAGQIDAVELKKIITDLGFQPKALNEEAGKEKFEFIVKTDKYDVPIAAEISGSKNYLWLTVYLGDAPKADSPICHALLARNFKIQPCQFYITERGALMLGIAMENRGITQAVFHRTYTKVSQDVVATADIWAGGSNAPQSHPQ